MKSKIVYLLSFIILSLSITGCGGVKTFGEDVSKENITKIEEILINPKAYDGRTVTVRGRIVTECPTGCWFNLKEGGAVIYVDLNPSGLAIPQKVGRPASVKGEVTFDGNAPVIIGKGVEV